MRSVAEKLTEYLNRDVIIDVVSRDIGERCLLKEVGETFIVVQFNNGKEVMYLLENIISIKLA